MTHTTERRKGDRGRPRSGTTLRPDLSASDQILDAAAHLFAERGYAATSTRAIADEVGIRQASLYYHFPSKEQILEVLLMRTVRPSMLVADFMMSSSGPATARLYALISFDANQLFTAAHNIGTLYYLPEVRHERFEAFRTERARLRQVYGALIEQGIAPRLAGELEKSATGPAPVGYLVDVVFGMVESAIALRADRPDEDAAALVPAIAQSCLRVLGHDSAAIATITKAGDRMLGELAGRGA